MSNPEETLTTEDLNHEVTSSEYEALYGEVQAENERLKAVIAASRIAPVTEHPLKDAKPSITAERVKALVGQHGVNKMTRSEKLASLQIDPTSVDDTLLRKCFGRGNDGSAALELHKTSPLRYRQLKEASLLLGIFAN
jgi:hypothetical protein